MVNHHSFHSESSRPDLTPAGREFFLLLFAADHIAKSYNKKITPQIITRIMDIVIGDKPSEYDQSKYDSRIYWERRNAGLCPHCGREPAEGYVYCREYRIKKREHDQRYKERRIQNLRIARGV